MIANSIGWLGVSFEIQAKNAFSAEFQMKRLLLPVFHKSSAPWYRGVRPSKLPIIDGSVLPHAEFRPNDHRKDAPHFTTIINSIFRSSKLLKKVTITPNIKN